MKLNLPWTFIFPSHFVNVLVTQQFNFSGFWKYNYKHVNKSSPCCKRNLPILRSISRIKLYSHATNISKH